VSHRFHGVLSAEFVEPLTWPAGWPRSKSREDARFSYGRSRRGAQGATMAAAEQFLLEELERLGAKGPVRISTNLAVRIDGRRRAGQDDARPSDPGVVVYFKLDGQDQAIPNDRWLRVADNLYAIGLSIAALRGLERWGSRAIVTASFRGFKALPPSTGPTTVEAAMREIETLSGSLLDSEVPETVRAAIRTARVQNHPDAREGDRTRWDRVERAVGVLEDNGLTGGGA
jgi:hypothetical protein